MQKNPFLAFNRKKPWFTDVLVGCVLMPVVIFVCLGLCLFPKVSEYLLVNYGGGLTGDCPESASYGSVAVVGRVHDGQNNPVQGVQVQARKGLGECPQSQPFEETGSSDLRGEFLIVGNVHLGDPTVSIEISAEGYASCRFEYAAAAYQHSILELTISLAQTMQVEGYYRIADDFYQNLEATPPFIQEIEICS